MLCSDCVTTACFAKTVRRIFAYSLRQSSIYSYLFRRKDALRMRATVKIWKRNLKKDIIPLPSIKPLNFKVTVSRLTVRLAAWVPTVTRGCEKNRSLFFFSQTAKILYYFILICKRKNTFVQSTLYFYLLFNIIFFNFFIILFILFKFCYMFSWYFIVFYILCLFWLFWMDCWLYQHSTVYFETIFISLVIFLEVVHFFQNFFRHLLIWFFGGGVKSFEIF